MYLYGRVEVKVVEKLDRVERGSFVVVDRDRIVPIYTCEHGTITWRMDSIGFQVSYYIVHCKGGDDWYYRPTERCAVGTVQGGSVPRWVWQRERVCACGFVVVVGNSILHPTVLRTVMRE